jgi:hypothetical protein
MILGLVKIEIWVDWITHQSIKKNVFAIITKLLFQLKITNSNH